MKNHLPHAHFPTTGRTWGLVRERAGAQCLRRRQRNPTGGRHQRAFVDCGPSVSYTATATATAGTHSRHGTGSGTSRCGPNLHHSARQCHGDVRPYREVRGRHWRLTCTKPAMAVERG